jgi:hypothetical protein
VALFLRWNRFLSLLIPNIIYQFVNIVVVELPPQKMKQKGRLMWRHGDGWQTDLMT